MRWFSFLNLTLLTLFAGSLFLIFVVATPNSDSWSPPNNERELQEFPKMGFDCSCLEGFHSGAFALDWSEPKMQIPDLKPVIIYHGVVRRPDMPEGKELVHLALQGADKIAAFDIKEPVYLLYSGIAREEDPTEIGYSFSPYNQPTPLWIDLKLEGENLKAVVHLTSEQGEEIDEPSQNQEFSIQPREIPRLKALAWTLDSMRIDSTLLIRQKARWIGKDLFLEIHGGEEFAPYSQKERIDFLGDIPYSCFVTEGSFLAWKEGRWRHLEQTEGLPLLVVKKIDERLMNLELWDAQGQGKTLLTLVRAKDPSSIPNLEDEFRFIGAKTWAKFIVESHNERLIVKPHDWLVLTDDGWLFLDCEELIDDYVDLKLQGPLLVLDKLTKQNGKQALVGHIFNKSRTEVVEIELTTNSSSTLANSYTLPPPPTNFTHFDLKDDIE